MTARSLQQLLDSRPVYQRSFVPSNDEEHWYSANRIHHFRSLLELVPISNDHVNQNQLVTNTLTSATQTGAHVSKTTYTFLRVVL